MAAPRVYRVLELYSGIGGMHCALKESGISYTVVAAVDINTTANRIYHSNFPHTTLISCGIEKLTTEQMNKWKVDMILMSPPCQPFTRVGKKRDVDDIRAKSFLHVLSLLERLEVKPDYILVENVKGFEKSQARQCLIETLKSCHYVYQEFLLTPLQFGIPNSRLRYYLTAKKSPLSFTFTLSPDIQSSLPSRAAVWLVHKNKTSQCCHDNSSSGFTSENCREGRLQTVVVSENSEDCRMKMDMKDNSCISETNHAENNIDKSIDCCTGKNSISDFYNQKIQVRDSTAPQSDGDFFSNKPISDKAEDTSLICLKSHSENLLHSQTIEVCRVQYDDQESAQSDKISCSDKSINTQQFQTAAVPTQSDEFMCSSHDHHPKRCDSLIIAEHSDNHCNLLAQNSSETSDIKSEKLPFENGMSNFNNHSCLSGKNTQDERQDYENYGENLRLGGEPDSQLFAHCERLGEFMEKKPEDYFEKFLLGDRELKMFVIMDIVHSNLRKSSCFTRRYGHYMDGAGPIVQMSANTQVVKSVSELKSRFVEDRQSWEETDLQTVRDLRLRYFTPREIANLLCFTHDFVLPEDLSIIQLYRCLGNSLNVHVVSVLIRLMTE